jgi:hypothetical protein
MRVRAVLEDPSALSLRFRSDAATHKRLEEIVAAEAECCSFLGLELDEHGGS